MIKRRYQAVIRKVINAVLIYFLDYNFTKCLLKGAGCILEVSQVRSVQVSQAEHRIHHFILPLVEPAI